jgi:hypothetical protein
MIDARRKPRPARVKGEVAKIPLGVRAKHGYALVDKDMSMLADHKWTLSTNGYAFGSIVIDGKRTWVYMHRLIMGLGYPGFIDHISHDKLDNRRSNLRFADHSTNQANKLPQGGTSKYKGVSCISRAGGKAVWRAKIKVRQTTIYLGYFKTEQQAAAAYNNAARKHFGAFACLNDVGNETT